MATMHAVPALGAPPEGAETLPLQWYTDPSIFALEMDRIFGRHWQYAGLTSQVPEPGDYFRCDIGPIDAIVVRDQDGELNAFVNSCPHRGAEIVGDRCGRRTTLQCVYHAWTFGLDGGLKRAPRSDYNPLFRPEDVSLHKLKVETLGQLIFVNPDLDAPPVRDRFGTLIDAIERESGPLERVLHVHEHRTFEIPANWKLQCENNVECYHCPTVHPLLSQVAHTREEIWSDVQEYYFRLSVRTKQEQSGVEGFFELQEGERRPVEEGRGNDAVVNYLWPNFFFTVQPGTGIATASVILPVSVDRSMLVKQYCFADDVPEQVREDFMNFADSVFDEDRAIVGSVQRGLTRGGARGRGQLMLPNSEHGIRWQQMLAYEALAG